jgi:hypothetical protein
VIAPSQLEEVVWAASAGVAAMAAVTTSAVVKMRMAISNLVTA